MAEDTAFTNTDFIANMGNLDDSLLFKYYLGEATKPSIPQPGNIFKILHIRHRTRNSTLKINRISTEKLIQSFRSNCRSLFKNVKRFHL